MTLVIGYSLVGALMFLYACQPMAKFWDKTITSGSCINLRALGIFYGVSNTVTDFALLLMPVFCFWKVRIPIRQKIGLALIFMAGGL